MNSSGAAVLDRATLGASGKVPANYLKLDKGDGAAAARKQAMDDDLERLRMERDEGRITAAM